MEKRPYHGSAVPTKQYERDQENRLRPYQMEDGGWHLLRLELYEGSSRAPHDWESPVILRRSKENSNTIVAPFAAEIDFFDEDLQKVDTTAILIEGGRGPNRDRDSMFRILGKSCIRLIDAPYHGTTGYFLRDSGLEVPFDFEAEQLTVPVQPKNLELSNS